MLIIRAVSVHNALAQGLMVLKKCGVRRDSRNGPVLVYPEPVATTYLEPTYRVLLAPERDANPFFHLMEALWMLAGRDDLAWPARFVARMEEYSDDGVTLWGAYGKRWRGWFAPELGAGLPADQLQYALNQLREDPDTRRCVVSMWDPYQDPPRAAIGGRDVPCNTHLYPYVDVHGRLCLTVCCRSNDVVWGAYGANAVHFSVLLEWMAAHLDREVGTMTQLSNNWHAYGEVAAPLLETDLGPCPYTTGNSLLPHPLVLNPARFDAELGMFMTDYRATGFRELFFKNVAVPMVLAHDAWSDAALGNKRVRADHALVALDKMAECDWKEACTQWLLRRAAP